MTASRSRRVAGAIAVMAATTLPSFLAGPLIEHVRDDFAFGDTALGITFSVYWAIAAVLAVPAAELGARLGPARALRLAGLLSAAVCAAVAAFATSGWAFALCIAPGGLAMAVAAPAMNVVIVSGAEGRRRALTFAIATSSPPLGMVLAGTVVPALGPDADWRMIYAFAAVLALAAALSVRGGPRPAPVTDAGAARPQASSTRPLAVMMAGVAAANATLGVFPAFLVAAAPSASVSGGLAAAMMAVGAGTSIAVRVALGRRADGRDDDQLPVVAVLMGIGAVGLVLLATSTPVLFVLGTLLVIGPGWAWLGLFSYAVTKRYADSIETASGVMWTGFFAGGVIGPAAFGALTAAVSFQSGWAVLAVANAAAALSVAAGRTRLPSHEGPGAARPSGGPAFASPGSGQSVMVAEAPEGRSS
jgi:predicted MFS family arabinose efflux permease